MRAVFASIFSLVFADFRAYVPGLNGPLVRPVHREYLLMDPATPALGWVPKPVPERISGSSWALFGFVGTMFALPVLQRRAAAAVESTGGGRATGTVKFFNRTKGFGFIVPEAGGTDVFVHISAVQGQEPREGDKVEYDLVYDDRRDKERADNVTGGTGGDIEWGYRDEY
jgi:CspA family cold shock protein